MIEGIYLLLGTNLGDKKLNLSNARQAISDQVGTITQSSSLYKTAAWGKTDQPAFLNQVISIKTNLKPFELLKTINCIEKELGRVRVEKWGERLIDIDILYYNTKVIDLDELKIPHPGISERRFTLMPLNEIAPDFINPVLQKSNAQLLEACKDKLKVETIS